MELSKEDSWQNIVSLAERFGKKISSKESNLNIEEQTKKDFIQLMFHYLNWDVSNEKSDDVFVEVKSAKKRLDYIFKLNGVRKFIVEAKSADENLDNLDFMNQAIAYAWAKSVRWAVLTNFKRTIVFSAEWKAKDPRQNRIFDIEYNDYGKKFNDLWFLSKNSFEKGELDKFGEETFRVQKKVKINPVMKELFLNLMIWRKKLSADIKKYSKNDKLITNEEILDETVQRILDRLIFIRVIEDTGWESEDLRNVIRESNNTNQNIWKVLRKIFDRYDKVYDSKLFRHHIADEIELTSVVLQDIINGLYISPDGTIPYNFADIDADVLGNIYEEYLGYVLKRGKEKLTENYLHRKEMGIYYTPTFVVNYIVKNTIGNLLGKKEIKILDPACGSGSFLIKAFEILLNRDKAKNLTFDQKVNILRRNIYGVDLDPKAAEIAQLNLLLRTVEQQKQLPMLQGNIEVGNSLIEDPIIANNKELVWKEKFKEKYFQEFRYQILQK